MLFEAREILILLLFFLPLERIIPLRPAQPVFRRRWQDDLLYFILNPWLIRAAAVALFAILLKPLQEIVPSSVPAFTSALPIWAQVIAAMIVAELGFYAMHRLFHAVPFLWRFHAVHHSIEELDWLAAHRVHPVDQIMSSTASLLPLLLLGFTTEAIAIKSFGYFLQSHLVHANIRLRLGPLEHVLASPHFHHWHHAQGAAPANFGGQLVFLDQLFGTHMRPRHMPGDYGIADPVPALFPLALLWPFTRPAAPAQLETAE